MIMDVLIPFFMFITNLRSIMIQSATSLLNMKKSIMTGTDITFITVNTTTTLLLPTKGHLNAKAAHMKERSMQ